MTTSRVACAGTLLGTDTSPAAPEAPLTDTHKQGPRGTLAPPHAKPRVTPRHPGHTRHLRADTHGACTHPSRRTCRWPRKKHRTPVCAGVPSPAQPHGDTGAPAHSALTQPPTSCTQGGCRRKPHGLPPGTGRHAPARAHTRTHTGLDLSVHAHVAEGPTVRAWI